MFSKYITTCVSIYVCIHNSIMCLHKRLTRIHAHRYCGTYEQKIKAVAIAAKKKARQERAMSMTSRKGIVSDNIELDTIARSFEGISRTGISEWDSKNNSAPHHAHLLKHANTPNAHNESPIHCMLYAKTSWYTLRRCPRLHSLFKYVCCCVW